MLIHNSVGRNDDIGQNLFTDQNSKYASAYGSQACITDVLACNGVTFISECLQSTDLCPLFFHHTRHCCKAD